MIIFLIVGFLISLLPDITISQSAFSGLTDAISWIGTINYYIPFDTFLLCLGIYCSVYISCVCLSAILKLL